MPVAARDAASVIILRDASDHGGMETLMVRRNARSDFAGDMYVFPGGGLEECDCEEGLAVLCAGLGPDEAMSIVADAPSPASALGLFIAGIRETFEETGILLAREASGEFVSFEDERAERFSALREAARDNLLTFKEMIAAETLELATGSLVYFAHWITPEFSPIRFDTRFFLAPAPPFQTALHDNHETTGHMWITPREALERNEKGTFPMLPPTVVNLMALKRFASAEEALTFTAGEDIAVIAPRVVLEDGRMKVLFPGDPGY
jgi:8-oxo-dGTP pyrophosphatase MutT (NUDIX family)